MDILAARAVNDKVAEEVRSAIAEAEMRSFASGRFAWGYGNITGGLTSIEEKSYGALAKSGTRPVQGLLKEYGLPPGKGSSFRPENLDRASSTEIPRASTSSRHTARTWRCSPQAADRQPVDLFR